VGALNDLQVKIQFFGIADVDQEDTFTDLQIRQCGPVVDGGAFRQQVLAAKQQEQREQ